MARRAVQFGVVFLVLGLVLGGVVGGVIGTASVTPGPVLQPPGVGASVSATTGSPEQGSTYAALYRQTIDSVVKITVTTPQGRSQGSGFVYNHQYVVTNRHVVGSATEATVQFSGGEYRTGTVVGTDAYSDLAVLRVPNVPSDADPLPVAKTEPVPGQPVVALGTPFGLEGTITHGIVSGVNRSMTVQGGFTIPDTVQTDAPINPGNSGGPLVAMNGAVVGVNRAKEGDNVGFAISASVVRRVVPSLIENGTYAHSFVGIKSVPVTPNVARVNDLSNATGVMVVDTFQDGPANGVLHTASVETVKGVRYPVGGDVIVAIDGTSIQSSQGLSSYLLLHTHPGQQITMTVVRNGTTERVQLQLAKRPSP